MTTRRSKARPKYKALFLGAAHRRNVEATRANLLARKLWRIQQAIAPRAEAILAAHEHDTPRIALDAHDFVCVEAQFELNQRFGSECDTAGFTCLSYKETPVVQLP